jgi:hypothetical protein
MAQMIAQAPPGRKIHVTGDAAYAGGELKKLPPGVIWTTRLRKDAAAVCRLEGSWWPIAPPDGC